MERNAPNVQAYTALIAGLCHKDGLRHLRSDAVAKVVEHGSRLAEDQDKLSTHFGRIADLLREADVYAGQEGAKYVAAEHIRRAIEERAYRSNLPEQYAQESIARGELLIDTAERVVGQINGLSVLALGDYEFGRPARITASVGRGRWGVLDIEREAKLGGPIHTKGVLILGGYLASTYAQDKKPALAARIVFEQSYGEVDGDSASCAELYALLSALADLPLEQGIAVTGAVNQRGQVQAVGGVNEKIEGFFETCERRGLTGRQGVIIPRSNVRHLMLKEEVVEAVSAQRFHVWAADHVDEGIEILTGVPAGTRDEQGRFTPGSVHARVDDRLRQWSTVRGDEKTQQDSEG